MKPTRENQAERMKNARVALQQLTFVEKMTVLESVLPYDPGLAGNLIRLKEAEMFFRQLWENELIRSQGGV